MLGVEENGSNPDAAPHHRSGFSTNLCGTGVSTSAAEIVNPSLQDGGKKFKANLTTLARCSYKPLPCKTFPQETIIDCRHDPVAPPGEVSILRESFDLVGGSMPAVRPRPGRID
jgi:hypothetical protein